MNNAEYYPPEGAEMTEEELDILRDALAEVKLIQEGKLEIPKTNWATYEEDIFREIAEEEARERAAAR